MRVLIIDSDDCVRQSLATLLRSAEFVVDQAEDGEDGIELAGLYEHDVIVLDAEIDAIRTIRRLGIKAPIMMLSAMKTVEDIVAGLGAGADDYLTKPGHPDELVARLSSLVRRSRGLGDAIVTTGNLSVNVSMKRAMVNDAPIALTAKEYQVLEILALRKGSVITRGALLDHLYGGLDEPDVKIIDVFICMLRKKLKAAGAHPVETIWGRGYVLQDHKSAAVDMTSEVRSLTDDPPTGYVSDRTFSSLKAMGARP
jgi:two-component system cell cycle response regulator CtrA